MKVLIVEDNEDSRILLQSMLEGNGYEVHSAENGNEALDLARDIPVDLVVSDILMPEMDGYTLCRAIKNDEHLRSIPFIFYSATYTDAKDQQFGLSLGACRFLIKPMEMQDLFKEIEQVLFQDKGTDPPSLLAQSQESSEFERNYSKILSKKLEKKVKDLEEERHLLEESKNRYQRLVETLRDDYIFYTCNAKGTFTCVSPSITHVLGYSHDEFITLYSSLRNAVAPDRKKADSSPQGPNGEKQATYEMEIDHKDGSRHYILITESPMLDKQGAVLAVEGIVHDVTRYKQMEKEREVLARQLRQSQKMESIGTLAGGIAHDFNNILTPIIGYTDLILSKQPPDSEYRDLLQEVLNAGHRARDLVKQILAFSRQSDEKRHPIFLQSQIKEALHLLRASLPTTIVIKRDLDKSCRPTLANPTHIHQIIMNLCTNAYHAMRDNGGELTVSLQQITLSAEDYITSLDVSPGEYLRIGISDTGKGIDPSIQDRIFEPYFTTKSKEEGTGLGLSVVHGIVKSYSGHITVYSEPGKGTTFHVYLPAYLETESDADAAPEEKIGGKERILLVDDDLKISGMETKLLRSIGYTVAAFNDARQALKAFGENPLNYDLIITDMTMPGMSGAELAKTILDIRPDIPVILCSGFSEMINEEKARALGIREYIIKPFTIKEISEAIHRALPKEETPL